MKHFIDSNGQIHAFEEDGSQDHLITEDMQAITEEEKEAQLAPDPLNKRKLYKSRIDTAAGRARARFVSPGSLIDAEYIQAESAAQAFADAGYTGEVPASVQSWADVGGMTAQEAAEDILATAQQWRAVLDQIRATRLSGKAAVDSAVDGDIETMAQSYIDQLDAMVPA